MIIGRYTTLSIGIALAFGLNAQVTLESPGNVPAPGVSFKVHRAAYVPPAPGGADQLYNFAFLVSDTLFEYQWQDPADLPNAADFPGAEFALTNGGPDTIFYRATASGLERVGDTQTISALGTDYHLSTGYSNSVLDLKLPSTYGDQPWMDLFSGSFTVDGATNNREGAINGEVDAWGWIVLPDGDTVEVVRVTTRVTETIPLSTGLGTINVAHTHNQSAYYPAWGKFPVLRTVSDTLDAGLIVINHAYTEWLHENYLGLAGQAVDVLAPQLFPNPSREQVTLVLADATTSGVEVQVTDARGAMVFRQRTGNRTLSINTTEWEAGVYQVIVIGAEGQRSAKSLVVLR